MNDGRVGKITSFIQLFESLSISKGNAFAEDSQEASLYIERLFIYCMCWSIAALLEADDRAKFDKWLRDQDLNRAMPIVEDGETIYEYFIDHNTFNWKKWVPPAWEYPLGDKLDFSNLLVPTMNSTRALYVIKQIYGIKAYVLILGAEGTAKTSVQLMFLSTQNPDQMLTKRINFSSATTSGMAQYSIEAELDKRGGKTKY